MNNEKYEFLEKEGLLNQKPERISPSVFAENDFFDPLDITQVRYEMLRSARIGKTSVAKACKLFGFSREYFYRLERNFMAHGLVSLLGSPKGLRPLIKWFNFNGHPAKSNYIESEVLNEHETKTSKLH